MQTNQTQPNSHQPINAARLNTWRLQMLCPSGLLFSPSTRTPSLLLPLYSRHYIINITHYPSFIPHQLSTINYHSLTITYHPSLLHPCGKLRSTGNVCAAREVRGIFTHNRVFMLTFCYINLRGMGEVSIFAPLKNERKSVKRRRAFG